MQARPPVYLAPYVIWLGLADWLSERWYASPQQAMDEARVRIRRDGAFAVRQLGVGSGLFGLCVLFVTYLAAPLLAWSAVTVPDALLVPFCGLLAASAVCALAPLFLHACLGVLARLYERGIGVLERRALVARQH
jgi:hypothetical protein